MNDQIYVRIQGRTGYLDAAPLEPRPLPGPQSEGNSFEPKHDPSYLIEIEGDVDRTSLSANLRVYQMGSWHEVGICLIFLPTAPADPSKFATETLQTWPEFIRDLGAPTTIIPRRHDYARLIDLVGRSAALKALTSINDVSALRLRANGTGKPRPSLNHPELIKLLSVDTEAFLSYTTLNRLIDDTKVIAAPHPSTLECEIDSGGRTTKLSFAFPADGLKGKQPINALIGPNGTGKTRTLVSLAKQAKQQNTDWPQRTLLYAQDPRSVKSLGLSNSLRTRIIPVQMRWGELTRLLDEIAVTCGHGEFDIDVVERLFRDVLSLDTLHVPLNPQTIPLTSRHSILRHRSRIYISYRQYLESASNGDRLFLDHATSPMIANTRGELFMPSSGESTITCLLASMFCESRSGTLVLIDEPETNLHPRFIALLMRKVSDMLLATNSLSVMATHSPFVVRELDRGVVSVLKSKRDFEVDVFYPTLQTHGANVSDITAYVFDDDDATKAFEEAIDAIAARNLLNREETLTLASQHFGSDGISFAMGRKR